MELIPEENISPISPGNDYIIDDKCLEDRVFWFERRLDKECHIYGWGRGLRKATQLYKENIVLENDLRKKQVSGFYRDIEIQPGYTQDTEVEKIMNTIIAESTSIETVKIPGIG